MFNWELLVFLKENIGFLKAGELPGAPGREGWAPLGALLGASGRSPGAVGRVLESRKTSEELRGRFLDLWEAHLEALGTTLGDLGVDFLKFLKNSLPTSAELMRIAITVSVRIWRTPAE